jgi:hypothetical protein
LPEKYTVFEETGLSKKKKSKADSQLMTLSTIFRLFLFSNVVVGIVCAIRNAALETVRWAV